MSRDPGQLSSISSTQVLQELSLEEGSSGWDNAVSLLDHVVGKPGFLNQLNHAHGQGWDNFSWDLVSKGVQADVDDLQKFHIHLWLHPGLSSNGVENVLGWVQLQQRAEAAILISVASAGLVKTLV